MSLSLFAHSGHAGTSEHHCGDFASVEEDLNDLRSRRGGQNHGEPGFAPDVRELHLGAILADRRLIRFYSEGVV